jgi:hypothetical protein
MLNTNLDGYKKCIAMQLGLIYDSQVTNRKKGGLPVRAPLPRHLGVIHNSQPLKMHKIPQQTSKTSNLLKYRLKTHFFVKAFNKLYF